MEGGITSGVVYPLAAVKLSETYEFKNVGGTSAGAIAAAAVAAAQHGKANGSGTGFDELRSLPTWLGANLTSLFQPNRSTKPLFGMLLGASAEPRPAWRGLAALSAAMRGFPVAALAGALPGAALAGATLAGSDSTVLTVVGLACALLLLVLGVGIGMSVAIARRVVKEVPANGFGLVNGYAEEPDPADPPLTMWLADLLDRLAGMPDGEALTFKDLWGGRDPDAPHDINLEMMTTCLTQTQPYRLPFREEEFWFWPEQFARLFPRRIVEQMIRDARDDPRAQDFAPLVPLPPAADLPVVVATRMSLSFPLLISAVPLYAIDYSQAMAEEDRHPEPCWFSDGGITSNFPIHFFDSPVPRWPTFVIDLRKLPDGWSLSDVECENVWMVPTNDSKGDVWWNGWDKRKPAGQLLGFATSIVKTMQTWMDTTQSHVQGYRDRIVHIEHTKTEGGMNLSMPPPVISRLSERGECAGEMLRDRFATPAGDGTQMNWDNQRWIRYRSFMRLLEHTLTNLRKGYTEPQAGDRPIDQLSARAHDEPPEFPWVTDHQREFAKQSTTTLVELVKRWQDAEPGYADGAPEPAPELRVAPRI